MHSAIDGSLQVNTRLTRCVCVCVFVWLFNVSALRCLVLAAKTLFPDNRFKIRKRKLWRRSSSLSRKINSCKALLHYRVFPVSGNIIRFHFQRMFWKFCFPHEAQKVILPCRVRCRWFVEWGIRERRSSFSKTKFSRKNLEQSLSEGSNSWKPRELAARNSALNEAP